MTATDKTEAQRIKSGKDKTVEKIIETSAESESEKSNFSESGSSADLSAEHVKVQSPGIY